MNGEKIEIIGPPTILFQELKPAEAPKGVALAISGNASFEHIKPYLSGKPLREPIRPKPQPPR